MKVVWAMLALVGVSLWYIPGTISLFSGQHSFYNIDPEGNQIPCKKCHGDIALDLHTGFIHSNFTCADCHRIQKNVQYASGDGAYNTTPGTLAHAASSVLCAECHSEFISNTPDTIHAAFIRYGIEQNTNVNCIACHTAVAVSINWTRPAAMSIDTISDGHNITITGTGTAYRIRVETFGNRSGDVLAVSDVTVI